MTTWCEPGDLLIYSKNPDFFDKLVDLGEELEDGVHKVEVYHIAVALDRYKKIEALTTDVAVDSIDYGNFVICRPPYDPDNLKEALRWALTQEGKPYGWLGVIDQGLRDISGGLLHFPKWIMIRTNNRWPYCSWLTNRITHRAGWTDVPKWPPPSPEDIWLRAKAFLLKG